jgi:hypothetical protein
MFGFHPQILFIKRRMYAWSIKRSLFVKLFLQIGVIFRDESNEPSFTMIGYNDVVVTTYNHFLIVRSKILLATAHATVPRLWRLFCN